MDTKRGRYSFRGWPAAEYIDFFLSIGSAWSAFFLTLGFLIAITLKHITIEPVLYSIPIGFGIFAICWVFDSIAHRSLYKFYIGKNETAIHNKMVFGTGIPLFISFGLAYWWTSFMLPFIFAFLFLKTLYSIIDETLHWKRFADGGSDSIETWAHYGQFLGNILYDVGFIWLIFIDKYEPIKALFR